MPLEENNHVKYRMWQGMIGFVLKLFFFIFLFWLIIRA